MAKWTSRFFAASALTLSLLASAPSSAEAPFRLTVLHINDVHSRILPINKYDSTCGEKRMSKGECFGGMARLGKAIMDRRAELVSEGKNVATLDAGDQFQGSLFYTTYKGDAAVRIMNKIGFDAMVVGNHEFDNGPNALERFINKANFPVISGNVDTIWDVGLKGLIPAVKILNYGAEKVAILGLTTEDTNVGESIKLLNVKTYVSLAVAQLEADGIKKIILLSHLGLPKDKEVAAYVSGIDLIVGGHSHTLMSNSDKKAAAPYPVMVTNPKGRQTPIVQAYAYSKYLGEIEVAFNADGHVVSATGDTTLITQSMPEDTDLANLIADLNGPLEAIKTKEIGEAAITIDADRKNCRAKECLMGNLVSDAILWKTEQMGSPVQLVIQNGGGLRASIDQGTVTMGEVLTVLPFQNTLATFKLKGSEVWAALENGFSKVEEGAGRFPQVGGMKVTWDPKQPAGTRVVAVEVSDGKGGLVPIDLEALYRVASNNYMRGGGDGYKIFAEHGVDAYDYGPGLEEVLAEYIAEKGPVAPKLDGRIKQR